MLLLNNFQALGTSCWIEIFDDNTSVSKEYLTFFLENIVKSFEKDYSRFLPDSLLNKLNKERILKNPPLEFIDILSISEKYHNLTCGVFDIKIGHILNNRGYGKVDYNFKSLKNPKIIIQKNCLKLEGNFLLDLGGIGKSYLINKISKILEEEFKIKYYFINFGGDIVATSEKGLPFEVILENPLSPNTSFGKVPIFNSSVCASSPYKRVWKGINYKDYNHFVSFESEFVQNSAFVFAPSVIDADVYATSLCINSELTINDPQIGYIILDEKGKIVKAL